MITPILYHTACTDKGLSEKQFGLDWVKSWVDLPEVFDTV